MLKRYRETQKGHTNCLSLADDILLLGVVTKATSHPVGSKSFASAALELNVGAVFAKYEMLTTKELLITLWNNWTHQHKKAIFLPVSVCTMARAKALLSSILDASGVS